MRRHKDVTVVTNDHLLDEIERSQLDATRRRRSKRATRSFRMTAFAIGFVGLAVFAAPSVISHTGIANSMLASQAAAYGWDASVDSISVGWITPLTAKNLSLKGQSGETRIQIDHAASSLTAVDLIRFSPAAIGELSLRGVMVDCAVDQGRSSLESDLAALMEPTGEPTPVVHAKVQLQECQMRVTDSVTQQTWSLNQANTQLIFTGDQITGEFAGVVSEPSGPRAPFKANSFCMENNPRATSRGNSRSKRNRFRFRSPTYLPAAFVGIPP